MSIAIPHGPIDTESMIEVFDEVANAILVFRSPEDAEWYGLSGDPTYVASRPAPIGYRGSITISDVLGSA